MNSSSVSACLAIGTLAALCLVAAGPLSAQTGVQFNGIDQYISFGNAATLGLPTFTLEGWVRRDAAGQTAGSGLGGVQAVPLICKGRGEADGDNRDTNYFFGIGTNGALAADFEESAAGSSPGLNHPVTGTTPLVLGQWHHVAATYDGASWRLYLDGQLDAELLVGEPCRADSIQHASIASALNSSGSSLGYLAGVMDEVRIWNVARTQQEIISNMHLEVATAAGLVGRWGLDEGTGPLAGDSTLGAPGTLVNGASWVPGFPSFVAPGTNLPALIVSTPAPTGLQASLYTYDVDALDPNLADTLTYSLDVAPAGMTIDPVTGLISWTPSGAQVSPPTNAVTVRVTDDGVPAASSTQSFDVFVNSATSGGYALAFNGSNEYVTFGNAAALGLPAFTLETWVRQDGPGSTASSGAGGVHAVPLVCKGRGESEASNKDTNYFFGINTSGQLVADLEEGALGASPGQNHPIIGTTVLNQGQWYHVAVTYDGNTWNLYVDGQLDGTLLVGQPTRSDSIQHASLATAMNSSGMPIGYLDGVLDEVRIWNHARTQQEIASQRNLQLTSGAGLIARWGLNEGTGNQAADTLGISNGTLVNGPTWVFGFPDAAVGTAFVVSPIDAIKAGFTWPAFTVRIENAVGGLIPTAENIVTISLSSGAGTLSGTLSRAAVAGVATFDDISYDLIEAITIDVTSIGLTGIPGTSVDILNPYEGCGPGFWRKEAIRLGLWPAGISPNHLFSDYFEDAFPGRTLEEVLRRNGGPLNQLGKHAVAALLNAAHPLVNYQYSQGDVISMFNGIHPQPEAQGYTPVLAMFGAANDLGASLDP